MAIPVEHLEYAIRRRPSHDRVKGDVWRVDISEAPKVDWMRNKAPVKNETLVKTLTFIKTASSWALFEWSGY